MVRSFKTNLIHIEDNFFSLGGDSIRSMMAVSKLEELLNIKLENSFFYKYPTLVSQKHYLEQYLLKELQSPLNEYELLVRSLSAKK